MYVTMKIQQRYMMFSDYIDIQKYCSLHTHAIQITVLSLVFTGY